LVSYQGTLAYSSLFVQDNTPILLLTDNEPNQYGKDFHIFSRANHFQFYMAREQWENITAIAGLLLHAIRIRENN
jgi:hypothetical protein